MFEWSYGVKRLAIGLLDEIPPREAPTGDGRTDGRPVAGPWSPGSGRRRGAEARSRAANPRKSGESGSGGQGREA